MNTKHLWMLAALAAILTASCAGLPLSKAQKIPSITSLAGPVWNLVGFHRESGFVPLEPGHGSSARILFQENGRFEATTGWTVFEGSWTAKENKQRGSFTASFTPDKSFRSLAPNIAGQQFEEDFLQNLRKTKTFRLEKSAARFLDVSGQPLLDFLSPDPLSKPPLF